MRLLAKIFISSLTALSAALAFMGALLIKTGFDNSIERERKRALDEYRLISYTLQAGLQNVAELTEASQDYLLMMARETAGIAPSSIAIHASEGVELFSNMPDERLASEIRVDANVSTISRIMKPNDSYYLTITGSVAQSGIVLGLAVSHNINSVYEESAELRKSYIIVYAVAIGVASVVLLLLSAIITVPIKKLTRATVRIANGHYDERCAVHSSDETGMLADSFNAMAETVEANINELKLNAKQKEDFMASFAHELKTPLTSVIGYADMIYRGHTTDEELREASYYILNEGMRLESLSLKLMELIVMGRSDYILISAPAADAFGDIMDTLRPLAAKRGVDISCSFDNAYIRIEPDLFKTMLINLVDNAMKALMDGAVAKPNGRVEIDGVRHGKSYDITITDNGRGMREDELSRITEAFYMIDKSRSRKQNGAGLGLAIANRIAAIHGSSLRYKSRLGVGTMVGLTLNCEPIPRKEPCSIK